MTDREKVIKGLDTCYYSPAKCKDCPYHDLPDEQYRPFWCSLKQIKTKTCIRECGNCDLSLKECREIGGIR